MEYKVLELLVDNFCFTFLMTLFVALALVCLIKFSHKKKKQLVEKALFVSAGQELDLLCSEIDMQEETKEHRVYKRTPRELAK